MAPVPHAGRVMESTKLSPKVRFLFIGTWSTSPAGEERDEEPNPEELEELIT